MVAGDEILDRNSTLAAIALDDRTKTFERDRE